MYVKKKILFFHQSGAIGGAGLSLLHILDNIDTEKYDISVVCPKHPMSMINELRQRNLDVIETEHTPIIFAHYNGGIKNAVSLRTIINLYQLWRDRSNVEQILKDVNPDIVAVNSMTMFTIGKHAKKMGKKTVCFHRETYQKGLFGVRTRIIKAGISNNFDKVVFISQYDCKETTPCNAKKYVIYDKVDIGIYHNEDRDNARKVNGLTRDEKAILFLGGVSKLKGAHVVLDSMNYIKKDNIKLLFVGNIEKERLESPLKFIEWLLAKLRLESFSMIKKSYKNIENKDRIVFLPMTVNPEKYFAIADIVVFPSTVAHQARPIYEAGAANLPIIVSDFKETSEFAKNAENVITFTAGNSVELAKKIEWVACDEEIGKQITKKNHQMTLKDHNIDDLRAELKTVFEDL